MEAIGGPEKSPPVSPAPAPLPEGLSSLCLSHSTNAIPPMSPISLPINELSNKVYKLVLTGGPCGGKSTAQNRLANFFEDLGWTVFTVPETATILLRGRVKFAELSQEQTYMFQRDLLATMLKIENVFFNQADLIKSRNVLIICDRGSMDPSAYSSPVEWRRCLQELNLNEYDLKCSRYDQVAHLVTAADGAEKFYTLANNDIRSEGLELAKQLDMNTRSVWVGHPYFDIIGNEGSGFDEKVNKLIQVVCDRTGTTIGDRFSQNSKKRKWIVSSVDWSHFEKFEEFDIENFYLLPYNPKIQQRFRRRTQNNNSSYQLTTREYSESSDDYVERRMNVSTRDSHMYANMKDTTRVSIFKKRRCFMHGTMYFKLDVYMDPLPPQANGKRFVFLETYTTLPTGTPLPERSIPPFILIGQEITGLRQYSMYSLSKLVKPV